MKRKYINPCSEVVLLNMEQAILSGSLGVDQGKDSFDAASSYSNKKSPIWE